MSECSCFGCPQVKARIAALKADRDHEREKANALQDELNALGQEPSEADPEFRDCSTVQYIGSDKIGTVIGKPRWTYAVSWDGSAETEEVPAHMLQIVPEGGESDGNAD